MTVHKLTAGDGYTYLTRQVAASDATTRGFGDLASYYTDRGEAPGVWMGRGLAGWAAAVPDFGVAEVGEQVSEAQMKALFGEGRHPNADLIERAASAQGLSAAQVDAASRLGKPYLVYEAANEFHRRSAGAFRDYNRAHELDPTTPVPDDVRAQIRTRLARTMFVESYGREPVDARELSGHLARISRQATTAVAGYDLTFSPVKSVSTLWAIAPRPIAAVIETAHADAVADTLTWLEDHAAFTRIGTGGVAQVEVHGLIAAAFTHRDSRAGDPDLHTHVAISNKVQTLDGRWYALDGRPIYRNNVAASERYNTRLEALLIERLGVAFADRPGADPAKRPVREIVGVDGDLPRSWSSRRAAIDARRAVLSATFQTVHGRPPTAKEAIALAQQANLETRQRKHEPRSAAEQRAAWRAEAVAVLGSEARLHYYVRDALRGDRIATSLGKHKPGHQSGRRVSRAWIYASADTVLATVASERATWQPNHVRAEAERHVRAAGVRYRDLDRVVDGIVAQALAPTRSLGLIEGDPITERGGEPARLRRTDGSSVFTVAGSAYYTSAQIVAAEQGIVAAAARRDGRTVSAAVLAAAVHDGAAPGGLNPGQVQLVRELAGSGARVQLALAPAGTGKTTAMRVLASAWAGSGGTVLGLAPSAAAAAVLREELGPGTALGTDTVAKLIHHLRGGPGEPPPWLDQIGPDTLVIIDEAGMASTPDLAAAIAHVIERGGSVRLVGDDQQLAAIGAGGVLRDLADTHGAVTLSQVMRFTHPAGHPKAGAANRAEGAASLALRDGDPAAIGYYLDHQRVHIGDLATVTDTAYTAWANDRAGGADAVMLAPTRDLVADLNRRARADRLAAPGVEPGREVRLADASHASRGDTILTRRNNRHLTLVTPSASGDTDWVKNGDRWHVDAVHESGALDVTHLRTGRQVTLPADYVAAHVELGYACTVHGAQGITADTCHTVATGEESRQLFYVAMTRGRHANHVHLATTGDGDPHTVITRDALLPPTAGDILARILTRDDSPVSATSQQRELTRPDLLLAAAAARYRHALATAAEDHLGPDRLSDIDSTANGVVAGITRAEAYPTLRAHLALLALGGDEPADLLHRACSAGRGLADARDVAAVLDWRMDPTGRHSTAVGPLPWLPAIPPTLAADPDWGHYLTERITHLTQCRATLIHQARGWTPTSAPAWATPLIEYDPHLVADLAVWRATHGIDDTDRRPTGDPQPARADARAQRSLDHRVTKLLGDPRAATTRWAPLAATIDARLSADPYWPSLAARLSALDRTGIDVATLTHIAAGARVAPLPDEHPAPALWWRLASHLSPAALAATEHSHAQTLRPDWTPFLAAIVGPPAAARILADPAWPALVAAVTTATQPPTPPHHQPGWEPEQILSMAYDLLHGGQPDDEPLRPGELAAALAWRIGLLTDATAVTGDGDTAPPTDPSDMDAGAGRADFEPRLHHVPMPDVGDHAEDWIASLLQDTPPPAPDSQPDPAELPTDPGHLEPSGPPPLRGRPGGEASFGSSRDPLAETLAAVERDAERERDAAADHAQFWASAAVPRARLVELNALAQEFFADHYRDAWAAGYLTERLGTDLVDDPRFGVGYAPDSWTALTHYLRRRGASDAEILSAGLGVLHSTSGTVIDRFRDRLMFPINATDPDDPGNLDRVETRGFIGRRNPIHTDTDGHGRTAGPKYLNTADTDLFAKGHLLYGLVDNAAALATGATPVLVEGPIDAIAITLAGRAPDGQIAYVGVAPLGTAFTDTQADALRPYLSSRPTRPGGEAQPPRAPTIVATDNDQAGHTAAHRGFWQLAARGEDPRQLLLPPGTDPAELFQTHGPQALRAALDDAPPLAERIIADRTAPYTDQLDTIEGRIHALRQAADVIGALPPSRWHDRAQTTAQQLGVASSTALNEVLDAGHAWTEDPHGRARHRLTQRIPAAASTALPVDPTRHWASLADILTASTGIDLRADPHWPVLAEHLTHAAATGYDVDHRLIALTANRPLPDQHPARDLDLRLISDWPECLPPTDPATTRADHPHHEHAAAHRLAVADQHPVHRAAPDDALPAATPTRPHPAARPTSTPPVTPPPRPPRGPAR